MYSTELPDLALVTKGGTHLSRTKTQKKKNEVGFDVKIEKYDAIQIQISSNDVLISFSCKDFQYRMLTNLNNKWTINKRSL